MINEKIKRMTDPQLLVLFVMRIRLQERGYKVDEEEYSEMFAEIIGRMQQRFNK